MSPNEYVTNFVSVLPFYFLNHEQFCVGFFLGGGVDKTLLGKNLFVFEGIGPKFDCRKITDSVIFKLLSA